MYEHERVCVCEREREREYLFVAARRFLHAYGLIEMVKCVMMVCLCDENLRICCTRKHA